jgi:predicted ATP-dependent endonuclease of OLD family
MNTNGIKKMDIQTLRKCIERKKGQQNQLQIDLQAAKTEKEHITGEIINTETAQAIIQTVAQKTQEELEYRLSEIVSLALTAVFEDPYKLKVLFVIRRNKTECDLLFEKNGEIFDPISSSGGGAIDVAAMALRITIWSLTQPKPRNVLILDEPFRFLSKEYQIKASTMLSEISKKLKLQIIMVSHSESLIEGANKVFRIAIKKGVSNISCIN